MNTKISNEQIATLAVHYGFEYAALKAIIEVESGGKGFALDTGKILIQFEPSWFKRLSKNWEKSTEGWLNNKVESQAAEWIAFNAAFQLDPAAAMESTSIGMMQVMGFHWKELGFKSVGEMWDYAKFSEANQIDLALRFILNNPKLTHALKIKDWPTVAYYYNGSGYKKFDYDNRLAKAYTSNIIL